MKSTEDLPSDVIYILGGDDLSTQWTKTTSQYKDRLRGYRVPIIKIRPAYINTENSYTGKTSIYWNGLQGLSNTGITRFEAYTVRLSVEPYDEYASVIFQ